MWFVEFLAKDRKRPIVVLLLVALFVALVATVGGAFTFSDKTSGFIVVPSTHLRDGSAVYTQLKDNSVTVVSIGARKDVAIVSERHH